MGLTASDWIGIAGVAATVALGMIALVQNARYKKQSDNFIDLQSMPEIFPLRTFDVLDTLGKMPIALRANISTEGSKDLYFSVFYAENVPIYDLTVSEVWIDGKNMKDGLGSNAVDVYPMNTYLRLTLAVPDALTDDQAEHEGQVVFSYKNQYSVEYEKKLEFCFTGTQVSSEKMARAKRKGKSWRK